MESITITRGGKQYLVYKGIDENNDSVLYLESVHEVEKGLRERWYFVSLYIEADKLTKKGKVILMKTEWRRSLLYPTGEVMDEFTTELMITKESDRELFNLIFGDSILTFMANGLVRDPWGYDELPIYDSSKQVITYTEEQENSLPTHKYNQ